MAFRDFAKKFYRSRLGLPQTIWLEYGASHRISKLGFPYKNKFSPRSFDIVGAPKCSKASDPWTVLLHVADAGVPSDDKNGVFKTWVVPPQNRKAFKCIGLRVEKVTGTSGYKYVPLRLKYVKLNDIRIWEIVNE